jgi:hypothetical protein
MIEEVDADGNGEREGARASERGRGRRPLSFGAFRSDAIAHLPHDFQTHLAQAPSTSPSS